MKGLVLAGGLGTRLQPLTKITNKHLLPVYNKPMILYPLETLKKSGIDEIMVVCGREHAGHFMNFLGSGKEFGIKLSYALQDKDNGGIADAIKYAEDFADNGDLSVILGDNIFDRNFKKEVADFSGGAMVFFKEVADPQRFGVPVFNKNRTRIIRIDEKPKKPKSSYAQVGFYIYDNRIFKIIKTLKPSARGELELTDVNNVYIERNQLSFSVVSGKWFDTGTFDSLLKAGMEIAKSSRRHV